MQVQIRRRVVDQVPVVFRIMPPVIAPLALTEGAVQVLDGPHTSALTEDRRVRTDKRLAEGRRLAHETMDYPLVGLGQHGGDHIPFGGEVEQGEEILDLLEPSVFLRGIDVAELIDQGPSRAGNSKRQNLPQNRVSAAPADPLDPRRTSVRRCQSPAPPARCRNCRSPNTW